MEIKTSEFFCNIKKLPPPGSKEFKDLIDWEVEKILGGVRINGVFISGWLYWHLNHWWIRIDGKDNYGNSVRLESRPILRDNEWIRAEALERCRIEKKGYMEIGARQTGKSEMEASFIGMNAIMFKNTQNVIVCGNDNDLSLLKDKIDFGLKKLWEGISIPRLDKTWRSNQIRLGYKSKNGDDEIWSYLIIRNAKDGYNTEVTAGTTARSFIMDEVGKYPFAQAYKAGEPAIKGDEGFRAIPILVGTGGSFENGKNAEEFFFNPDANNFLSFTDEESGRKTCMFISGLYRNDCKEEMDLATYLRKERNLNIEKDDELSKIKIMVSNKEKALQKINEERETAKKNPDRSLYLKQVMYFPLKVEECFLTKTVNIFNVYVVKKHLNDLKVLGDYGVPVELYEDDGVVRHVISDKQPITTFPTKHDDIKDAPILIYEFPISERPPFGLYVAGVDSYRQGRAEYSTSLGTVYIFKRQHNITGEKFQNMFVASYAARPEDKEVWNEQARLLIKYYNARTLCENDDISFIDYMISKNEAHLYLEPQPSWIKEISKYSTVKRSYGIHRSNREIVEFLHGCLKKYIEEPIIEEKDENGNVLRTVNGVNRILDIMLLEEIMKFNESSGNYDRIVAAELALALAYKLDPIIGKVTNEGDSRYSIFDPSYSYSRKSTLYTKNKLRKLWL